ncbi:MAG: NAD(+) synthase, partial [Microbacteriaceae bacterium]|nr:NAD(+) synthase [Microbacteriaceae bacterium]
MRDAQQEIIAALGVTSVWDAASETKRRIQFLVEYAKRVPGCRGFVLGVSGGQDSSLAARIAQLAVQQLRSDGHEAEFIAVRLPYGTQLDEDDAQLALQFIQADRVT